MHLREIFHGTLIFQQSGMVCIGRHVGGHTLAPGGGGALPYLGDKETCRWTGYGFLASLS